MKNSLFRFIIAASILLGADLLAQGSSSSAKAIITVHPDKPGVAIPADFLGFSYEKAVLADTHFRPNNTEMINLYRNLGGGVLRFGGNRVEKTYWRGTNSAAPNDGKQFIGPVALDNLYAFAKQTGWRVIHGLNLAANDPAMAADEATYALQVGGPTVLALEVGNEPDFYSRHGLRATNYLYRQYRSEAEAEQRVILAKSPNAPLAGPATTKFCTWFPEFVADFKDGLALATSHFYSLSARATDPRAPNFATVENLLSAATRSNWLAVIGVPLKASRAAGIPFRLGECNSVSNGGTDGVSDVFASALWGADFLFDLAEQGVAGINFHGGFRDRGYRPFCFRGQHYHPHPLYYGMLLFHQAARGRVVPVDCQTPANVTAHAVLGEDGKLRVVVINKDLKQRVIASVETGSPCTKAEVIHLTAPSVTAKEGVTLAGSVVAGNGTWKPQSGKHVTCVNGRCELSLPPASAALLVIE